MSSYVAFPYRTDGRGGTHEAAREAWLHGLIEQLLFTLPGERVNRPDFGCGLMQLVFAPNSPRAGRHRAGPGSGLAAAVAGAVAAHRRGGRQQ